MKILAIYDICHPKRLNKVARIMKDYGIRVQKSKFELEITQQAYRDLKYRISKVICPQEDGVKYIPLCMKCRNQTEVIGQGKFVDPDEEFVII